MEDRKLNRDKTWKVWKKNKLNSEQIWKITENEKKSKYLDNISVLSTFFWTNL